MNDIVSSVDAPRRGGAGESKSEQVPRRLSGKHKPRVVIVGGGFAGIVAPKSLRGCDANVTLIDRHNHHVFQPLLYQVATDLLVPSEVATPIADCAPEAFRLSASLRPSRSISQRQSRGECRLLKDISNMAKVRSVENIGA
jgi:NADH:ubiquinone reductase (H+-translocating)